MNRDQMLQELSKLPFMVMWSEDERAGNNVGWTEHPIWINKNGVGYYSCDEPVLFYKVIRIPDDKWNTIIAKLQDNELEFKDILNTPLIVIVDYQEVEDRDELNYCLSDLLNFPKDRNEYLYITEDGLDGPLKFKFFNDEKAFLEYIDRDYCFDAWNKMSDEDLRSWVINLNNGEKKFDFFTTITQKKIQEISRYYQ